MTTTLPRPSRPSLPGPGQLSVPPASPAVRKLSGSGVPQLSGGAGKSLRRPSSFANLQGASNQQSSSSVGSDIPRTNSGSRISSLPPTSPLTIRTHLATPLKGGAPKSPLSLDTRGSGLQAPRPSLGGRQGSWDTSNVSSRTTSLSLGGALSPPSPSSRPSSALAFTLSDLSTYSTKSDTGKDGKGNVVVSLRVRPDNDSQQVSGTDWTVEGSKSLVRWNGKEGGDYYFDNVFPPSDNNSRVYESCCKRLVRRVMEGYHGTIFAYGMTGTGKTFSMQGTPDTPGVIPLAVTDIFSFIRETPHREFLLRVSYLEIYNEKIHDLLSAAPNSNNGIYGQQVEEIRLREDSKRGVYATPLKEEIVQSPSQLLRVIARGDNARKTGSTQFNARSSRSHAVVQIVVESRDRIPGTTPTSSLSIDAKPGQGAVGGVRVSTLSLIDLAGSERAAENKERRQEGAHINRSLLTLGTVIARLSEGKEKDGKDKDTSHLPYRDSKLTRLLQPALSGNSLISILCTMQTQGNHAENLNTLKFGARARNNIVSHAKKAEESIVADAGSRVLLERYRHEIAELRGQLEEQVKMQTDAEEVQALRHEEQMVEIQLARTALKERIEHLNRLILSSKSSGVNTSFSAMGRLSGISAGSAAHYSIQAAPPPAQAPRTFSSSTFASIGPPPDFPPSDPESDDSGGEYGDGTASLEAQIRSLQADNADKTRYIATLEKRLLQARRTSSSRTSLGLSTPPRGMSGAYAEENSTTALLREKDAEIATLRAQLDDKDKMVAALRSSARQREVAELRAQKSRTKSVDDLLSSKRRTNGSTGVASSGDVVDVPEHEDEVPGLTFTSKKSSYGSLRNSASRDKRKGLAMSMDGIDTLT